jgi:hypothetical protein
MLLSDRTIISQENIVLFNKGIFRHSYTYSEIQTSQVQLGELGLLYSLR